MSSNSVCTAWNKTRVLFNSNMAVECWYVPWCKNSGLDMTETNKLIRNAIACKSLDERVRLEKSKNLTLETAISIGRMFKATRDGLQVMSGEDPRIEVSKVTWKKDSSRQHKKTRNFKKPKGNNEQAQKCDRRGYNAHKPQEKCPAKNESCNRCRKIGHFAQVCRSRKSIVKVLNETLFGRWIFQWWGRCWQGLTTTTWSKSRNKQDQRQLEPRWKGRMVWIPESEQ